MFPRAETQDWHWDMQLTGKVVLSAAALLVVTAVYRLYRSRPAPARQGSGNAKSKAEEEAKGSRQPAFQGPPPGTLHTEPRRRPRKVSQGARAPQDFSCEDLGDHCVLASGAAPRDERSQSQYFSEEQGRGWQDSEQVPLRCHSQESGTAVGAKPNPPHCPGYQSSEPESAPASLATAATDSSCVGGEPAPWGNGRQPEQPAPGEQEPDHQPWVTPVESSNDMNPNWVFTRVSGVSREEAGALQAASDMGLALHQQEGAGDASYTFLSVARVRMEENYIQQVEGKGLRLKGKVYDYYVESTSQAMSQRAHQAAALTEAPPPEPVPGSLGIAVASREPADDIEGGVETGAFPQPVPSAPPHGFSRKESLHQIVENPELQLQLDGFGSQGTQADSPRNSEEPQVQLVAGTNFFHIPLTPASAPDTRLDLGNCSEVLTLAKRQKLEALKEAAYKVMSDNYLQVLRSPDIYGSLSGAERDHILRRRLRGRKHLVVADVCPQEDWGRLYCYDDSKDAWHLLAHLPPEAVSWGCAICSLFNYIFVVSGCQGPGRQPSNRVFCYNPLTGIWSEVCPLNQARPHCRLVALAGQLYAIGGECLNTVERYDPRLDRWAFSPPLPNDTFALAHTATACADQIFVTGGTLRYLLLRFSVQEQRWRAGPTGGSRDRTAEMVAANGFLYRFDLHRSLGISVYRCSASTRLWYECATDRTPYPDAFQCAVVDDRIYCVGRQRTLCFLADHISPRFVPNELQSFPTPRGTLLPTVLTLPTSDVPQTRV